MKRIKELKRPSDPYNMSLRDIGYNEAIDDVLKILDNAGYRKAEEVRKETAKEILKWIKGIKHIGSLRSELDMIAIEYGVGVKE